MLTTGVFGKIGVAGRVGVLAGVTGLLVGGLAVPAVGAVGIMVRNSANNFNNMKAGTIGELPVRSKILDSQGHLIAYYYPRGIDRQPVSYSQIAPVMRNAIVAIEDSRFYKHGAIDIRGTLRALVNDLQHKSVQGGSTLTQQAVKNALILTAPNIQMAQQASTDTISRKIKELRLAIQVEKKMTKNQILAFYLNTAFWGTYFGNQAWGIKTAAMRYFSISPAKLDLAQSALLAGMVENPVADDPIAHPETALKRRNVVLARMAQLHYITQAHAVAVGKQGLGLKLTPLQTGCTSASAKMGAFFCDYVISLMKQDSTFAAAWKQLNGAGGLKVYTTLDPQDQRSAKQAVNYMVPQPPNGANPGGNAASEVLIQPGSGRILAIANDRSYGTGKNQTTEDYAVNSQYDGGVGVQTGSSSKLFTLITALEQGVPFGFAQNVPAAADLTGYTNCAGAPTGPYHLINDSPSEKGGFTLYTGTTQSVNVYYAMLERKVGLCNVVKTAMAMGVTRADGRSLLQWDGKHEPPADDLPSFTLGAVNVSPMSMAAAYATVAARGVYCKPVAVAKIISPSGAKLPVESAGCHQAIPAGVADAASYVLQGVLTSGTAAGLGIGRPAAGKTGTSDNFDFAAFGGYTPDLAGYVSVFNPVDPVKFPMLGTGSCYRLGCDGAGMFGADAPAHTWQMTFQHAALANPALGFVMADIPGELWSMGNGQTNPNQKKHGRGGNGGGGGGGNGGGGGGNGGGTGGGPPTNGQP
ncbi:MAG TPA: transglycosylase domain-containing protein [Streptosporangiaceae bacterium]